MGRILYLVRGLPGSGKTTFVRRAIENRRAVGEFPSAVAADDFFLLARGEKLAPESVKVDVELVHGRSVERQGRSLNERKFTYAFDPAFLGAAHAWCQDRVRSALVADDNAVLFVHNTFTQRWEIEPYLQIAEAFGAEVRVIDLLDGGMPIEMLARMNSHGVPLAALVAMASRYEVDWVNGDPRPPWTRK
jgi:RecA/RadA recombinase